jgi:hypothetical protein
MQSNLDLAGSPTPTAGSLVRVREMFVIPEAYVIAVAVWAGWTPVSMLLMAPSIAAAHGAAVAIGVAMLAVPMLAAAFLLLRRRRSARTFMLYATVFSAAVGGVADSQWLILAYAHQAVLVALLWLPRIDAVLSATYRDEVMPATPLVARSRRVAWAFGWFVAMFATGVAAVFGLASMG